MKQFNFDSTDCYLFFTNFDALHEDNARYLRPQVASIDRINNNKF